MPYFSDYKMHPPKFGEKMGGASYSPNVAYLAGDGWVAVMGWGYFSYFPPLKPGHILWSSASYSPKNAVFGKGHRRIMVTLTR